MTDRRSEGEADPTHDPEDQAPASRVGTEDAASSAPLPGTDRMDGETGGLAGTSR